MNPIDGDLTDGNVANVTGRDNASSGKGLNVFDEGQSGAGVTGETQSATAAGVAGITLNPTGLITDKAKTVLEAARDLIAIAAIFLFFTGFVYSYAFMHDLGIPLAATGMPLEFYFVSSYSVLASKSITIAIIVLTIVATRALLLQLWRFRWGETLLTILRSQRSWLVIGGLSLSIWACFVLLFVWSESAADDQFASVVRGEDVYDASVVLAKNADASRFPANLLDPSDGSRVYLITSNSTDFYFLLVPPVSSNADSQLIQISRAEVSNVRLDLSRSPL